MRELLRRCLNLLDESSRAHGPGQVAQAPPLLLLPPLHHARVPVPAPLELAIMSTVVDLVLVVPVILLGQIDPMWGAPLRQLGFISGCALMVSEGHQTSRN